MKRAHRTWLISFIAGAAILAVAIAGWLHWYAPTLEDASFGVRVIEVQKGHLLYLRLSGAPSAFYCVRDVTDRVEGDSVVIAVRLAVSCRNRNGSFEHEVPLPEWVKDVRFGTRKQVVWSREAGILRSEN